MRLLVRFLGLGLVALGLIFWARSDEGVPAQTPPSASLTAASPASSSQSGFSKSDATTIAKADQGVGDSWKTNAFVFPWSRSKYHFTTAAHRNKTWNKVSDLHSLGIYLHEEQDSYSHAGLGPGVGQTFVGHAPDITSVNPSKADLMAEDVYSRLNIAGDNFGTQAAAVPIENLMPFILDFNRAKINLQKKTKRFRI